MTEWLHWTDWAYWISFLFLLNSSSCLFRRRQWQPTPVLLPGKSHGRREESDMTERLHFSLSYIGEGNGNPLQCSCLENPRDSWAWWAAVYGVAQNWTQLKRLTSSSSSCLFTLVNYLQILNNIAIRSCVCNLVSILHIWQWDRENDSFHKHILSLVGCLPDATTLLACNM